MRSRRRSISRYSESFLTDLQKHERHGCRFMCHHQNANISWDSIRTVGIVFSFQLYTMADHTFCQFHVNTGTIDSGIGYQWIGNTFQVTHTAIDSLRDILADLCWHIQTVLFALGIQDVDAGQYLMPTYTRRIKRQSLNNSDTVISLHLYSSRCKDTRKVRCFRAHLTDIW